jgi:hypothetical protein
VVTEYVGLAGAAGLYWTSACDMGEGELESRLLDKPTGPAAYAQPDYGRIHQELRALQNVHETLEAEWTPQRLIHWGKQIAAATRATVAAEAHHLQRCALGLAS